MTIQSTLGSTTGTGTSTTLTLATPGAAEGDLAQLRATVAPTPDDGRVQFMEGNRLLGTAPIDTATGQAVPPDLHARCRHPPDRRDLHRVGGLRRFGERLDGDHDRGRHDRPGHGRFGVARHDLPGHRRDRRHGQHPRQDRGADLDHDRDRQLGGQARPLDRPGHQARRLLDHLGRADLERDDRARRPLHRHPDPRGPAPEPARRLVAADGVPQAAGGHLG